MRAWRVTAKLHQWMGTVLCGMFALWFFTGAVQIFVPFPTLGHAARLSANDWLATERIRIAPAEVLRSAGERRVDSLRLIDVAGEPRYLLALESGQTLAVSALSGLIMRPLDAQQARAIAEKFAGTGSIAVDGPWVYDQWTVHDKYVALRPYWRVSLAGPTADEVYVSATSGEVVQRTSRQQRFWNRVGAVVHWLNVPALRADRALWHRVMWTVSLAGIATVLAGLSLGMRSWWRQRRSGRRGLTPYGGLLGWHHRLGLFAGLLVLAWVGSGWLSLDEGRIFSAAGADAAAQARYRGVSLESALQKLPNGVLQRLPTARELRFTVVGGHLLVLALGGSSETGITSVEPNGDVLRLGRIPDQWFGAAVAAAWPVSRPVQVIEVAPDDPYQLRSDPWPTRTRRILAGATQDIWVHVDAATGDILAVMDRSRRVYRWWVAGLHNLDFAWLNHLSLWRAALSCVMAIGFTFSAVAVALGWRRLRQRKIGI